MKWVNRRRVPADHCSDRCNQRAWREAYIAEFGISYDVERGHDLRNELVSDLVGVG